MALPRPVRPPLKGAPASAPAQTAAEIRAGDEAVRTHRFLERIAKLAHKLKEANDNTARLLMLLEQREVEIAALKGRISMLETPTATLNRRLSRLKTQTRTGRA